MKNYGSHGDVVLHVINFVLCKSEDATCVQLDKCACHAFVRIGNGDCQHIRGL
jgi:predicted nucleic acid-binding Zn finger protein